MHVVKGSGSVCEHPCQSHANFNSVPSVLVFESESLELCCLWSPSLWNQNCTILLSQWEPNAFVSGIGLRLSPKSQAPVIGMWLCALCLPDTGLKT